MLTLSYIKK
ncbi:hypothetical protein GQ607_005758 [Colletotrichum asianum]|uniref:Uncharacterized protein n=1 Tax=Colletotrichum asianum TaxID=702518 RepID=A0A8H3ZNX8_9PEZI|nr:hypothetical protein GQ607_005758 [Colletotrichum asianum]